MCVLSKVYVLYGCSGIDRRDERKLVDRLKVLVGKNSDFDRSNHFPDGDWVKVVKHKLAAFFSYHMKQVIPVPPYEVSEGKEVDKYGVLFGGKAFMWLKRFSRQSERPGNTKVRTRFRSFLFSILQSKGGMPRASEFYKEVAVGKAVKALSQVKPEQPSQSLRAWGDLEGQDIRNRLSKETMIFELQRTVQEVFSGAKYTLKDRLAAFFPSTSSNYINSRVGAGTLGTLFDGELLKGLRTPGGTFNVSRVGLGEEALEGDDELFEYDSSELRSRFATLWFRVLKEAKSEEKLVEAVGLLEALKVRVITKGPPHTYFVLKALQKFMHSTMRQQKTFRFIGEPNTELGMLNALGRNLLEGQEYLSGDYSGATDNLYSWVSEAIAQEVSKVLDLSSIEAQLFKEALTGHVFDVSKLSSVTGFYGVTKVQQQMGQLMGSIISFPVLCLANAAMCRWAMEVGDKRVWKLNDAALTINGDDVALRSSSETYQYWSVITNFGGLIESIGKTFRSREWVSINSTLYERTGEAFELDDLRPDGTKVKRAAVLRQVNHINMGLLTGMKRNGGYFSTKDFSDGVTFASRANDLLRACPTYLRLEVYQIFLDNYRDVLKKTRLPWFIPEWLGGLGLPILDPKKQVNSDKDLRIALRIIKNWNKPGQRPVTLSLQGAKWKIRESASAKLPDSVVSMKEDGAVKALSRLDGLAAIDLLFDSNFHLLDLYDEHGELASPSGAVNHNARLWEPRGPRDRLTGKRDARLSRRIPDFILFGPKRFQALRVKDLAFGRRRFPPLPSAPVSTKDAIQGMGRWQLD